MKKLMVLIVALAIATSIYGADAVKVEAKTDAVPAVKAEAVVCADCAKLNKDNKAGDVAKLCPACQKKADEAKKTEVKPTEVKK